MSSSSRGTPVLPSRSVPLSHWPTSVVYLKPIKSSQTCSIMDTIEQRYLPCRVGSSRICQVELRYLVGVEPRDHAADSKRTDSTSLSVALLSLSDESSHVFDGWCIFTREAIALSFHTSLQVHIESICATAVAVRVSKCVMRYGTTTQYDQPFLSTLLHLQ